MDFDSELSSDLFCVQGNIMQPGNSSLAYILLNATLCQGSEAQFDTKYLLMELEPEQDYSFEIAKNVKIPAGEYECILEAKGPQGLLARESRRVSLVSEQQPVFELFPWPADLDPDVFVSRQEEPQVRTKEENAMQSEISEKEPADNAGSSQASFSSSQEAKGRFVGSITSKKYHRPDCRYALKIKPENCIYFQSIEDAERQGYLPCKVCNP